MCGIAGIISGCRDCGRLEREIRAMNQLQAHRGPDAEGIWLDEATGVALGHRRLSVIGLGEEGTQPMTDGKRWLVFNGEIYNYRELRQELGVDRFRTSTDSEVILLGYEKWGEGVLNRLIGMFAFAIWDPEEQYLFAARDRFGIKPFYFTNQKGEFRFASEAKSLLPFLPSVDLSEKGLHDYFTFQLPLGETTLFEGIQQLPAAHSLSFTARNPSPKIRKYWEVSYERDFRHSEKYLLEQLEEILTDSVSLHTRSDVPIGGYVSGGVDSSLISIMASDGVDDYLGFTGKFTSPDGYDESRYAVAAAKHGGFELLQRDMQASDFIENLSNVIYHLDYPVAGPGSFPQYMVSELAAQHRKVVLGGQGGDEIFGGYARYLVAYLEQAVKGAIEGTADEAQFILTYESMSKSLRALDGYQPMLASFWSKGLFGPRDERYIDLVDRSSGVRFAPWVADSSYDPRETALELFRAENVNSGSYFDEMTHFDFKTLLPGLLHVEDRMSMAHGLEARVPFLDHRIIELTATVPSDIKFRDGELKRFLRKSMMHKLPVEIVERTDKMGFPVPLSYWRNNDSAMRDFVDELFKSSRARNAFPLAVPNEKDVASLSDRGLWAYVGMEVWFQEFQDRSSWFRSVPDKLLTDSNMPISYLHKEKH